MLNALQFDEIIRLAIREDVGTGDITTMSTVPEDMCVEGRFIAKETGIICGIPVVQRIFELVDPTIKLEFYIKESHKAAKGDVIGVVSGRAISVLTAERTALNFLQHLSGIATHTSELVTLLNGTTAVVADTRKTTPGMRVLEKYAVKVGGGSNHRFNLSDGILIKDNHIAAAGGIANAIRAARANAPHMLKVEVEVENFRQLDEALEHKADIIMLDNMSIEDMSKAVKIIDGRAIVEASGNMGDKDIRLVASTGVNIISIGALTHTVRALDISLKFQ